MATEPKTIPPAIFQKRVGGNNLVSPCENLVKNGNIVELY